MDSLARTIFNLSPTGTVLLRPLYEGPQCVDFSFELLNLAAQHLLRLPAQPTQTFLQQYPVAVETGTFAFYRDTFLAGDPGFFGVEYHDGTRQAHYQLAAQRDGDYLVVAVTDTTDRLQGELAVSLQRSYQAEQQARAEAEQQRGELARVFEQAPAAIFVVQGPTYLVELVSPLMAEFLGRTREQLVGYPYFAVLPELAEQGLQALLDQVWTTGEPVSVDEFVAHLSYHAPGEVGYYSFVYQPLRDEHGQLDRIACVTLDVTAQVRARQHVEQLNAKLDVNNEELTASNEELRASNEELLTANIDLSVAQQKLRSLTRDLEARVQERTHQLNEQQGLLSQILGQVPASIATLSGPQHRYTFFNDGYQVLAAGRTELGRTVAEVFPEVEEQGFIALLDQVYATGQPFRGTDTPAMLYDRATGQMEQRYVDFIYQPLFNNQQKVQGILAFIIDVNEKVWSRQAQELQRQELQRLFAQAPVAICVFKGPDYVLQSVNPPMSVMLGRPLEHLVKRPFFEALPELEGQGLRQLLDGVRASGVPYVAQEQPIEMAHLPGKVGYFNFVYQPLRDEAGQLSAIMCVATEMTTQVQARTQVQGLNEELAAMNEEMQTANEELHDSNARLTRTNAELDTFVYTASHDLKSPITNVEGLMNALQEELPPSVAQGEVVRHLLHLMRDSVARFQQTLAHLTDLTRLTQLSAGPQEEVNLGALVEGVRLDLAPAFEAAKGQLQVDLRGCAGLYGSPRVWRSIIFNLVSNALKYRHPHRSPVVQVTASCTPQQVVLRVHDNGLGLSEGQQANLFQLFRRLHTHVEGSGVGLYSIKKLIENVGGTIEVESELNVGSTFTVRLPL